MRPFSVHEIEEHVGMLDGWEVEGEKLHRRFEFADFTAAFEFMTAVATEAEQLNHHPDWTNTYNVVDAWLTTHDAGGITELDFMLAEKMNEAYGE